MKNPVEFSPEDPLARIPGESRKANQALQEYFKQPTPRSLRRLAEENRRRIAAGEPSSTPRFRSLSEWSMNLSWQARVDAADELLRRQEADARRRLAEEKARLWVDRREELREKDWNQSQALRALADKILEEGPKFIKTTRKTIRGKEGEPVKEVITLALNGEMAIKAMETASKLMRLAAEMETESLVIQELEPAESIEAIKVKRWKAMLLAVQHPELSGEETDIPTTPAPEPEPEPEGE